MKIELSVEQLNIVIAALQELPHKHSDPIIREIIRQVEEQQNKGGDNV